MTPREICSSYSAWIIPRRWAALWLDMLTVGSGLLVLPMLGNQNLGLGLTIWFLAANCYFPLVEGLRGDTFGKWVCGLRVVDEFGRLPGLKKAAVRHLLRVLEINPLLFGAFPAGIAVWRSKGRQRFGDQLAHTFVMRVEDLPTLSGTTCANSACLSSSAVALVAQAPGYSGAVPVDTTQFGGGYLEVRRVWAPQAAAVATLYSLLVIGAGMIIGKTGSAPITISCAELLKSPPADGHYRVTDCHYFLAHAVAALPPDGDLLTNVDGTPNIDVVDAVFIPLHYNIVTESKPTRVLLRTTDRRVRERIVEMALLGKQNLKPDAWMREHYQEVHAHRNVTGHLHSGNMLYQPPNRFLPRLKSKGLSEDFLILNEGEEAKAIGSLVLFGGGSFTVVLAMMFWVLAALNMAGCDFPHVSRQLRT